MKTFKIYENPIALVAGLILISWLIGCGPSTKVFSDQDRNANMEDYRTFGWLPVKDLESRNNPLYYNELNDKRIKYAVAEQMQNRGYRFQTDKPELLIHYHIIVEDKTVVRTDPYGYYYGPYWMRTHVNVYEYKEGTLIIDMMDAETNNLVWRGWFTGFMRNTDLDKMEGAIDEAVMNIFSKYAYRAKAMEETID